MEFQDVVLHSVENCEAVAAKQELVSGAQRSLLRPVPARYDPDARPLLVHTAVDFRHLLDLSGEGEIDLAPWTAEVPLEDRKRAFAQMSESRGGTLKMVLPMRR